MPIEFRCSQCGKLLRVPDETAGRQAKCPSCGNVQPVPMTSVPASAPLSPGGLSPGGMSPGAPPSSPFGAPMPSSAMGGMGQPPPPPGVPPQRGSPFAQPQQPSAPGYGQSPFMVQSPAQPQYSSNPYQSPSGTAFDGPIPYGSSAMAGPIVPTRVEIGDLMSRAWEIYKQNFWMCAGAAFIMTALSSVTQLPVTYGGQYLLRDQGPGALVAFQLLDNLFNLVVQTWFTGGFLAFMLEIARGENPTMGRLFGCRGRYLELLAFSFLLNIGAGLSLLALIVGILFFYALFGLGAFFVIDGRAGPIEAFRASYAISRPNLVTNLLGILVAMAIGFLSVFACCVGVFFASGYTMLLASVAYLMMSGQQAAGGYAMAPTTTPPTYGDTPFAQT